MNRPSKTLAVAAVTFALLLLVPATADGADPEDGETLFGTRFTVDNVADVGDANPGDGRCSISNVEAPENPDEGIPKSFPPKSPSESLPSESVPSISLPSKSLVPKASFEGRDLPSGIGNTDGPLPNPYPEIPPAPSPQTVGFCTLRASVEEANALPDVLHVVTLPTSLGVYQLTEGQLRIEGRLRIAADQSGDKKWAAINAGHRSRVLDFGPEASASLAGLFIAQGDAGKGGFGGGVRVQGGARLSLYGSVVVHSQASLGGGIYVGPDAIMWAKQLSVEYNSARSGGGIYAEGHLEIDQISIYANEAVSGAGLQVDVDDGGLYAENTSILDNVAVGNGGGLHVSGDGFSLITNSTIAGNVAAVGGGVFMAGAPLDVRASVVAGNVDNHFPNDALASPDCSGPVVDAGGQRNLVGVITGACSGFDEVTNLFGSLAAPLDPHLEPVQFFPIGGAIGGGELAYRRPAAGSPLIDVLENRDCDSQSHDMLRAHARFSRSGGPCDLGAVER